MQGRKVHAGLHLKVLMISMHPYSGTQLSVILDAVPDMDSKFNFPQIVCTILYVDQ